MTDTVKTETFPITADDVRRYAAASGDHNPIHLDEGFARAAGLPGRIAHGMLEMGLVATAAARWAGSAEKIRRISCRFAGMLVVGDTLSIRGTVVSREDGLVRVAVEGTGGDGRPVLTNGIVEYME
ncbi:MaoC/PaaZ C-terminal domain-containing protein [Streptosporangium sp. NPDC051022]|uniref:MaoC family dehydratase n=1 Tax=Streptosporangium sp. NPDC051022 TaxID=3155752 RepID=UPI003420E52B